MQFPEGQSKAPSAEHCPAQLAPWPQVATLGVLSGWQQVTLLVWLEKVKALSKKSTEEVFPRKYCYWWCECSSVMIFEKVLRSFMESTITTKTVKNINLDWWCFRKRTPRF